MGPRQEEVRASTRILLAERGFRADRRAPGSQRELERRGGLLQVAQPQGRQDLPAANGGRVGIRLPCRDDNPVLQRRRSRDAGQGRQRGRRDGQGEVPGLDMDDQGQRRLRVHGSRWESSSPMPSGFTTCTEMLGSGCAGLLRQRILCQVPSRRPNRPSFHQCPCAPWRLLARHARSAPVPPSVPRGMPCRGFQRTDTGFRVARTQSL